MSAKPKKSDYKASAAEIAQARIGAQNAADYQTYLQPLAVDELADALTADVQTTARSRANADVLQGLTSDLDFNKVRNSGEYGTGLSAAYQAGQGNANKAATEIQNNRATNMVSTSLQQGADGAGARSTLSNIGTTRVLDRAKNKQLLRQARIDAGLRIAGAGVDKSEIGLSLIHI